MYVVFGASGRAGGQVVQALLKREEKVRAVVRRPDQRERFERTGAQVVHADLEQAEQIAAAARDATAVFLLNPPPAVASDLDRRTHEIANAVTDALRKVPVPRLVVLSSIGAHHAAGNGVIDALNQFETGLNHAAPAVAMLRSGYFIESWHEVMADVVNRGVLPTFLEPAQKIAMVSTTDVGATAAQLMKESWTGTRTVELSGPQDYSSDDVAAAFADAIGRSTSTLYIPPEQRVSNLCEQGLSTEVATALAQMYEGIAAGRFTNAPGTERRRGRVSLHDAIARLLNPTR